MFTLDTVVDCNIWLHQGTIVMFSEVWIKQLKCWKVEMKTFAGDSEPEILYFSGLDFTVATWAHIFKHS